MKIEVLEHKDVQRLWWWNCPWQERGEEAVQRLAHYQVPDSWLGNVTEIFFDTTAAAIGAPSNYNKRSQDQQIEEIK